MHWIKIDKKDAKTLPNSRSKLLTALENGEI